MNVLNFSLYLLIYYYGPIYLMMLSETIYRFNLKKYINKIVNKYVLFIVIPFSIFMLPNIYGVWNLHLLAIKLQVLGIVTLPAIIYSGFFFLNAFILRKLSNWDNFAISTLTIYSMSQIWEVPFLFNESIFIMRHLFPYFLKLTSIAFLMFYIKKILRFNLFRFHKIPLTFLLGLGVFLWVPLYLFQTNVTLGILTRIVWGLVFIVFNSGYAKESMHT